MQVRQKKILLIDDDENDFILTQELLKEFEHNRYNLAWVDTYEEGLESMLKGDYDIFLVDHKLGHRDGLELLREATEKGCQAPIILLTGRGGYDADLQAMAAGAADYLVKDSIQGSLLERSIRYALERKQAEEAIRREASRAETLLRVASRLNSQLDLNSILEVLCEESCLGLDHSAASVYIYPPNGNSYYLGGTYGIEQDTAKQIPPIFHSSQEQLNSSPRQYQIYSGLQLNNGLPDAQLYASYGMSTVVSVGIFCNGEVFGSLDIYTFESMRTYKEEDLVFLKGVADQAALAISNARLYEDAQRRLEYTRALHEIDLAITSTLGLKRTLKTALKQTIQQLGVDAAAVFTLNNQTGSLEYSAGLGFRTKNIQLVPMQPEIGLSRKGIAVKKIMNKENLSGGKGSHDALFPEGEGFVTYIGAPLVSKGEVNGVLEIYHREKLTPDAEWTSFLTTLAGQIAIAIDNALLFEDLQRSNADLVRAYDTALEGWSRALDLRDKETEGHTKRVTSMALRLASAMGVGNEELNKVRRGAILHDIGKMAIPDSILHKRGPLNEAEWDIMRRHSEYAYNLLAPIPFLQSSLDIPYCHHERWDGTGYPRRLKGEEIPLAARIFAIIDVWDALLSNRPYRKAWSVKRAREYIRAQTGHHFDPKVGRTFLEMVDQNAI
jgi:putative nucleotidyltransferase with HDIG domain